MGSWSNKAVRLEPIEFDGDAIHFQVKRLRIEDASVVMKFYDREAKRMRFNDPMELVAAAASIIPKYVVEVEGMKDAEGAHLTVEQFAEASKDFYFMPLLSQLFVGLMTVSVMSKADEKNSGPLSTE